MATITTINSGDSISGSRTVINTNFSNLNSDKIETSAIDTDTTLAANSDNKIPSQKAVKAYVDAGGNVNASDTVRGIVELATGAEITAGTATGGTGAALVITPDNLKASQVPIIRTYLASGSPHTWSKPAGIKYVIVEAQGAGGDGATDGAGGGAGGYCRKVIAAASLGSSETVTVGAAGVGSGNTSFGSHVTAGNGGDASGTTGGSGGTATGGDLNINGQAGESNEGGAGGSSILGMGGTSQYNSSTTATRAGTAGSGYGAGGSGGQDASDGSPSGGGGGAGTQGIVIVTEFYV